MVFWDVLWLLFDLFAMVGWLVALITTFFWSRRDGRVLWQIAFGLLLLASVEREFLIVWLVLPRSGYPAALSPWQMMFETVLIGTSLAGYAALTLAVVIYAPRLRSMPAIDLPLPN